MSPSVPLVGAMNNPGQRGLFITGTDTGIGKTRAGVALMEAIKQRGLAVAGMKPVASGCELQDGQLVNADAQALRSRASVSTPYTDINPYAFAAPIAPHIAAARVGTEIDLNRIQQAYARLAETHDVVVVEGVGGWRVPLNADASTVDLVRRLQLPVVLVIGLRLGCINHALLTHETIMHDGIRLAGWVASRIDPDYGEEHETLELLSDKFQAGCLGILPHHAVCRPKELAACLDITPLFS